jgi:CHAD domain-containing protein
VARAPRYGDIAPEDSVRTLADRILHALARETREHAPAAMQGVDVKAVHDMRVAIRRLRSALTVFAPHYQRRPQHRAARAFRRLGRRLGAVRDADVHLGVLRSALAGATDAERPGVAFIIEQLHETRRQALARFAITVSQFDDDAIADLTHDG